MRGYWKEAGRVAVRLLRRRVFFFVLVGGYAVYAYHGSYSLPMVTR